jgi:hypothetical protein
MMTIRRWDGAKNLPKSGEKAGQTQLNTGSG